MHVLVAYATRHGATAGIAERIAADLRQAGVPTDVRPVREVDDVQPYDAVVVGGAAYLFHWLREATAFVKRHRAVLAERPVWLFSSGPLGTDRVDDEGRDVLEVSRPKEFDELVRLVQPRGEIVFFGAWDADAPAIGFGERFVRHLPAASVALPEGDFREWPVIDGWAASIARELLAGEVGVR